VNQVTSASLRYPLSVFNKNSTLRRRKMRGKRGREKKKKEKERGRGMGLGG